VARSATASTLRAFWQFAVLPSVQTSIFPYQRKTATLLLVLSLQRFKTGF